MVVSNLSVSLADVVKQLKAEKSVLFEFLHGVMAFRDTSGSAIHTEKQFNVEASIFELYIDLMCQFKPHHVENFIKINEGYRLEETLDICRKHHLSEATAYLLEKAGDIQGAFGIHLENLKGKLKRLTECLLSKSEEGKDVQTQFGEVQTVLLMIVQLCQRNSGKMDEASREALWFPLLDALMFPQRRIKDIENKDILSDFKQLTHHVLNNMMGYIALPAILQKIMQDPAYNTGKFGEIRELILGMLETYNYEQTLMITCKNLLNHDIHLHLRSLTNAAMKGYIPRGDQCKICLKKFMNQQDTDPVMVFRCGHSYHGSCLQAVGSVHVIDGEDTYVCYLCSHTKRGQTQSSRFHRALSNPQAAQMLGLKPEKSKEVSEDPQHIQNVDLVRRAMRTPSRLEILTELAKSESSARTSRTTSMYISTGTVPA